VTHYFDPSPTAGSRPGRVRLVLPDLEADLVTDRGVFATSAVDTGTVALLKGVDAPDPAGDILDLGCGYGPIAVTVARRYPRSTVWAVDVNSRAVELTRANASALNLGNVRALGPDAVPPDVRFAHIWSNPPIRVGKTALHELLQTWLARLAPGGQAWLVVQKHLGSDSLAAWLGEQGHDVARLGSKKGYRILRVR
jgi:16S rRNA (guanine1207-N2)-methyltransferase